MICFQALVQGMIDVYHQVSDHFKATPAHPHYIFSLHDLTYIINGILLMSPRSKVKVNKSKKRESIAFQSKSISFLCECLEILGLRSPILRLGPPERYD